MRSYIWLLRAPENVNGQRFALLAHRGPYEVRLLEPLQMRQIDDLPFWMELYDRSRNTSIDSYHGDDIEQATLAADALILQAEQLDRDSSSI
jgi:hypothetical protein